MISVVMNTYMESVELKRYSIESILNQIYKDIKIWAMYCTSNMVRKTIGILRIEGIS